MTRRERHQQFDDISHRFLDWREKDGLTWRARCRTLRALPLPMVNALALVSSDAAVAGGLACRKPPEMNPRAPDGRIGSRGMRTTLLARSPRARFSGRVGVSSCCLVPAFSRSTSGPGKDVRLSRFL